MTAAELEDWLESEESRSAGDDSGGGESTGHASGRRIIAILRAGDEDLTEDDHGRMRCWPDTFIDTSPGAPRAMSPRRAGATHW